MSVALRTTPPGRTVVLYDGHCRFCTTQARKLARLTRRGAVDLVSFQDEGALERFPGLTHAACMEAMQLIAPDGRVYSGFEAAVHAVATTWWGRLAYLYYVPGLRQLLDWSYGWVARHRYRLMGRQAAECPDGSCQLHLQPPLGDALKTPKAP